MANFFKKLIHGNDDAPQSEITENEDQQTAADTTEAQPEAAEVTGLTKEQARAELERKIAQKLSSMPEADLNELLRIQEDKEKQRQENAKKIEERRKKRKSAKKAQMDPIFLDDAVLADYHSEEEKQTPAEPAAPEAEAEEPRIDGQVSIAELPKIFEDEEKQEQLAREERQRQKNLQIKEEQRLANQKSKDALNFAIPVKDENTQTSDLYAESADELQDAAGEIIAEEPEPVIPDEKIASKEKLNIFMKSVKECELVTDKIYTVIGGGIKAIGVTGKKLAGKVYEKNPELKKKHIKNKHQWLRKIRTFQHNLIAREKAAAEKMFHVINHMDSKNDELADKTTEIVTQGNRKFNFAREWAEINKKRLVAGFALVIAVSIGVVAIFNYLTAYEYAYNNRTLGMVKNQEDVLTIVDLVSVQLSKEHNAEIKIDPNEDITFKRVFAFHKEVDDMEQVLRRLTYMQNMNAKGYGIYIEGKWVATVDSKDTANSILDNVMATYMQENDSTQYEDVGFAEDVKVKEIATKLGNLMNPSDVLTKILTGASAQKVHVVESGETFSGIAKLYGISQSDLRVSNPTVTPERLSIGQEIILTQAVPLLTVQIVEVATYMEPIQFQTTYENNASVYKGEQSTKVKGVDGTRQVVAKIVRNNGIEVAKMELSSEILTQPVNAVIMVGTKELPPLQGSGTFKYPVSGYRMSSKFGSRWGRMHYGIDLACATGTKIRASDGGTVIFAGYSGSYGYVVKINHGGGLVSLYAHCSKLYVSKGDKVYQGQHIANVGSTGRSTGPHCHFQIEKNGTPVNPLNYL